MNSNLNQFQRTKMICRRVFVMIWMALEAVLVGVGTFVATKAVVYDVAGFPQSKTSAMIILILTYSAGGMSLMMHAHPLIQPIQKKRKEDESEKKGDPSNEN